MVPVDLCVNSILTAAWDVARQYNTKISVEPEIPVYNFCTPVDNELTWGDFTEKTIKYGKFTNVVTRREANFRLPLISRRNVSNN
jgi:hypothetical protein